jgi:serine phosphatase RsbU (regulator of sigma subunit)
MTHRLTPKARGDISRLLAVQTKTLGELLQEAGLVSPWQIESALQTKMEHPELRIGEIMAQKNLIKPKTADFFAQDLAKAVVAAEKNALGYYLQQAAILEREQIEIILSEQRASGIRFGTVAVFQGFIKSTTLDFFLTNLFPEESNVSPFINMHRGYTSI